MTATDASAMSSAQFEPLPPDRPADALERELLAQWDREKLFEQTLAIRKDAPSFVFFEGPPRAWIWAEFR